MMAPPSALSVVRLLAAALDRSDFEGARRYISDDCRYELGGEVLSGPDAIIASYRENAEWGSRVLDHVEYESQVDVAADGFSVLYTDRITHGGETVECRSCQHLWMNGAGQVSRIVHEELLGEREKLDEFFRRNGIRR